MEAVIRVKVSHQAGIGHWVRQCHLAQGLARAGFRVTLFPDDYKHLTSAPDGVNLNPVTGHTEFLERLPAKVDLAILDIHDTTPEFISQIRQSARYVAGFEDLGPGRNHLDCLIDCNLPPESLNDVADSVEKLFGWRYCLLAPKYETLASTPRDFSRGIQSILVTMGGTDPNHLTPAVIAPLIEHFPDLKITVVSGPGFKSSPAMEALLGRQQVICKSQPKSLAPLFLQHDAVICAGGVSLHEALVAGTPSFVVPQMEHQKLLTLHFQGKGATRLVGQPGIVDVAALLSVMATSPERLNEMSTQGRQLIDGQGLERIVSFLADLTSS